MVGSDKKIELLLTRVTKIFDQKIIFQFFQHRGHIENETFLSEFIVIKISFHLERRKFLKMDTRRLPQICRPCGICLADIDKHIKE